MKISDMLKAIHPYRSETPLKCMTIKYRVADPEFSLLGLMMVIVWDDSDFSIVFRHHSDGLTLALERRIAHNKGAIRISGDALLDSLDVNRVKEIFGI